MGLENPRILEATANCVGDDILLLPGCIGLSIWTPAAIDCKDIKEMVIPTDSAKSFLTGKTPLACGAD